MLSGCVEFVVAMALAATRAGQPAITQDEIRGRLSKFILVGPGIGGWLGTATSNIVFDRLARIELDPLSLAQFSQLLILGHQAPPSEDFLRYYWLSAPADHPYPIGSLTAFQPNFADDTIKSLDHLAWGLERLYADGGEVSAPVIRPCTVSTPMSSKVCLRGSDGIPTEWSDGDCRWPSKQFPRTTAI
jgi:pimeloyl-ACP methyl ester carboxylesterase